MSPPTPEELLEDLRGATVEHGAALRREFDELRRELSDTAHKLEQLARDVAPVVVDHKERTESRKALWLQVRGQVVSWAVLGVLAVLMAGALYTLNARLDSIDAPHVEANP